MRLLLAATFALAAAFVPAAAAAAERLDALDQWGQWRGPLGTGVAPHADPPIEWSEQKNVRWKTALPGHGHSTPIVWGDRIFITTAIPHGEAVPPPRHESDGAHDNVPPLRHQKFVVIAVDRESGAIAWQKTVRDALPHESTHGSGSWASNSAVTDGEHVYASFGSNGLYALDREGRTVWERDLGDMRVKHGHGEGSSPALFRDTLVVNWDQEGDSFVVALDKRTGEERWHVARDERTSWSTPLIVEVEGKPQVIVSATKRVRAYDLASGKEIWECGGLSGNVVATPVAANGYVYVANSYETRAMLAIRLAGTRGDVTGGDAVAWMRNRDTPYVPSPVLYGDALCFLKHYQGILTCVAAATGAPLVGPRRLDGIGDVYASLAGAADRIYVVARAGTTSVLRRGGEFEVLAHNRLDDSFSASPAIAGRELYLRGERSLYRVERLP